MVRRVAQNVSLTSELAAFIAERVALGRYNNASEVVRAALRSFERSEMLPSYRPKGGSSVPSR